MDETYCEAFPWLKRQFIVLLYFISFKIVIHPFQLILDLPLSQNVLLIFSDLISNLRISWFSRCWLLLVYVYDITYHIFHKLYQLYSWIYYIMYRWRFACATKYFRWWQHYDAKSFHFYGYFIFTKKSWKNVLCLKLKLINS